MKKGKSRNAEKENELKSNQKNTTKILLNLNSVKEGSYKKGSLSLPHRNGGCYGNINECNIHGHRYLRFFFLFGR